jgi:hypothetical protein
LKTDKERLERTVIERAAEIALLKKRELGLSGDLKGRYLSLELKESLVRGIEEVRREYGVSLEYCCRGLQLNLRRYGRWMNLYRGTGRYGGEAWA